MSSFSNLIERAKNNPSKLYLAAIIIFAFIMSYYLITLQIKLGVPYWDVFLYLNNALMFSGLGEGYKVYLPPLLSFLTSIIFRAGYIHEAAIFAINGIIFVLGIVGMYLLLKLRFSQLESFAGALLFSSFSVVLAWATTGALDVPGTCLTLLTIYTLVYGLRKDSKVLYLVFPIAALAFLTRYTAGLMIIPMLFFGITQIISRTDFSKLSKKINSPINYLKDLIQEFIRVINKNHLKKLLWGALIGIVIMLPFFGFFYSELGNPFPFMGQLDVSVSNHASTRDPGYMPDNLYYVNNIPNYISAHAETYEQMLFPHMAIPYLAAYILLALTICGFVIGAFNTLKRLKNSLFENNKKLSKNKLLKIIVTLISGVFLIFSLFGGNYLVTEALLLIVSLSLYFLLKDVGMSDLQLDLLIVLWFFTYLISHSFLTVKVDRYFITMAPALAYLIILGIRELGFGISSRLNKLKFKELAAGLLAMGLVLCVLLSSLQPYMNHIPQGVYGDFDKASNWLEDYDPQYQNKVIYSNHWPSFSWYLKTNVQRGFPKDFNTTDEFAKMLQQNNVTYFIDFQPADGFELTGYHSIYKKGNLIIYQRN